jgi:hypothetical protein
MKSEQACRAAVCAACFYVLGDHVSASGFGINIEQVA